MQGWRERGHGRGSGCEVPSEHSPAPVPHPAEPLTAERWGRSISEGRGLRAASALHPQVRRAPGPTPAPHGLGYGARAEGIPTPTSSMDPTWGTSGSRQPHRPRAPHPAARKAPGPSPALKELSYGPGVALSPRVAAAPALRAARGVGAAPEGRPSSDGGAAIPESFSWGVDTGVAAPCRRQGRRGAGSPRLSRAGERGPEEGSESPPPRGSRGPPPLPGSRDAR